jgi:RNA polymerase sigma-70 factor (ECF subfamily)
MADYGPALRFFIQRRVGCEADAAELAQQALVEAASNLSSYRGEAAFSTWVFGIASNIALNHVNRSARRRRLLESVDTHESLRGQAPDPFDVLTARQAATLAAETLARMPASMSEPLRLVATDDLSYEQVARQLSVPIGTVRSRVFRARRAIRERLQTAGYDA